jgi:two-component system nitrogen regulation response regulator NtrX
VKQTRLLIVDDDARILASLSAYLRDCGFAVLTAATVAEAAAVPLNQVDAVLLDLALPDGDGLQVLRKLLAEKPTLPVVMMSGQASLAQAVEAIKIGALDFLEKPASPEKVEVALRNALRLSSLSVQVDRQQQESLAALELVGESSRLQVVREQIAAVSETDSTVLLLGESGTGKEVAARLIHLRSKRCAGPLIAVNAAAIPGELVESEFFGHEKGAFTGATAKRIGKFAQAESGTIFLDEIAEMPALLQVKLLRVLEERRITPVGGNQSQEIDFRLICATNRDLEAAIAEGDFRRDLFYRINVFTIKLPALREISGDIPLIAEHHLSKLALKMGKPVPDLPAEVRERLQKYHFPGNVRELRNILEHLLIMGSPHGITIDQLVHLLQAGIDSRRSGSLILKEAVAKFERGHIDKVLRHCRGNVSQAAEELGLDRSYLYRKMKSLGLE